MLDSTCTWVDCDRPVYARGLCGRCHMRARRADVLSDYLSPDVLCRHCGKSYPEGTKSGKWFCSLSCQAANRKQSKALARLALLGERVCQHCQSPVPLEKKSNAVHCSVECQQGSWYLKNEERLRRAAREWAAANPDKRSDHHSRRRARVRAVPYEVVDLEAVWQRDNGICWICREPVDRSLNYPDPRSRSTDHVVPLCRGGSHVFDNVAIAHLRCNVSKRDKLLDHLPGWFRIEGEEEPLAVAT